MSLKIQSGRFINEFTPRVNKLLFWCSLFMAFPLIVIFQNISIYFFIYILLLLNYSGKLKISISKGLQIIALLIAIGAILSTLGGFFVGGSKNLNNSLAVLPNYLYWSFLIIFLIQYRNYLNYDLIFKGIAIGLLLTIISYFILKSFSLGSIFSFKRPSQNSFAFLLICFTPISVYYFRTKHGMTISILLIILFSIAGFLSGSRSGSVLVILGAIMTFLFSSKINFSRIIVALFVGLLLGIFIKSELGRSIIYKLNPRTYNLIYSVEETFKTDQSYLIRRALVEKGINLFEQYPITGVGLNNFGNSYGEIVGDFEGAQYVIHKGAELNTSAHNSYISLLSEGGLVLSIPFAFLLLIIILYFLIRIRSMPSIYRPVFLGVIMMAVHLYFISAILNVYAWFLLGLAAALVYREKEKYIVLKQLQTAKSNLNI